MKSVPRSPFTTPLSRSARETEPRIRGILPWKKQRPPLLAPVLAALILSCGGLAACQAQGERRGLEHPGRPGRPVPVL